MAAKPPTKWTQQRIAKAVKNPGTRANVPTNLLPSSYRQQRLMNQRLNAPVTEGSSLTNRDAARERNAQVDLKYGAAERQIQGVQKAIPQWYQQYRDLLSAANQGVQQGYQQATQQFQQLQAGTTAQQGQQELAAYQQQAQQLGQVADPNAQAVQANAAAIRGANAGNLGSVMAAQGANQNAYGQNMVANTGRHQIEQLLQEVQKGTDLSKEKGAYAQQVGSDIYDRERKQVLENQAFGLQTAKAQADVQNVAADNARADKQLRQQKRQQDTQLVGPGQAYTRKQWDAMSLAQRRQAIRDYKADTANPNGGGSGNKIGKVKNEPASSLQPRRMINARVPFVQKYLRDHHLTLRSPADRVRVVQALRTDHSGMFSDPNNERVLGAALDLVQHGRITTPNLQYLRRQGVYVASNGSYWGGGNRG